ncbi:uncharacterized protein OCT59_003190 [Rhizophagus irregularis]|uniref:BTB domain-containing protein n=1 Tax=Rhizophagus irregularis TaxID=588596 RepID=A0A915YXD4_9GLOM|nr:hypothetical protein OCT59_003190 [Rhizophagus irregularis]CAB4398175.1 unnamed protein product [Rhizophagus irregularis]CAB4481182.1 unnamed protein product [Rhizophagus irregularis]CAB5193111.1 unnamed protein product [Rhizophagus irregularis]CAB5352199.1 unnamed protein product [Rhizophagus irregularis]
MDSIKILLSDFRQIYEKPDDFDIVINVGKGENFKSFSAHSVILRARCPYFKKKKVITSEYYLENFSPEAFEFILKYIYTGECNIEEDIDMYQVLIASNELELTYLIDYAQNYIINNEEDWAENNIIRMYIESVRCNFTKLSNFYGEIIAFQPLLLFNSSYFNSLDINVFLKFLERNDINIDEIEIWDNIIKWGTAQRPRLNFGPSNYSNHDFGELQRRCYDLISKVKFFGITGDEYRAYVCPYRRILPPFIVDKLEEFYRDNY